MQARARQLSLVTAALLLLGGVAWVMVSSWGDPSTPRKEPAPGPTETEQPSQHPVRKESIPPSDPARTRITDTGEPDFQITGRVVDRYDEPLSPATVSVDTGPPTTTGADGRFTLGTPASGAITLLVQAKDHAAFLSEHNLRLQPGSRSLDVGDIQVSSGGGITGRILDVAGNPLPSATATLRPSSGSMRRSLERVGLMLVPVPTTADGTYRFRYVMPGGYRITATAPGMQVAYSNTVEIRDRVETKVEPIRLGAGFELTGVVLDAQDKPVAGAEVRVRNRRPRFRGQVTTQEEGRFQIGKLPPGPLEVEVTARGFLGFRRSVDPTRKQEQELVVRLVGGIRVTGTVKDGRSGAPVERFAAAIRPIGELDPGNLGSMTLQLRRKIETLRQPPGGNETAEARARRLAVVEAFEARLRRVEQEGRAQPAARPADVGPIQAWPGGRFVFEGVDEGVYAVDILSPEHQFVRVQPVDVRVGAPAPDLRVELTKGHGLSGSVVCSHDGSPIHGARVELMRVVEASPQRQDRKRSLYPFAFARSGPQGVSILSGVTDKAGRFELRQAPPGGYFLAVRHPRTSDYESEVFYLRGDHQEFEAKVALRAELSGRVHGIPQPRAGHVEVFVLGGHGTMRTVKVAADGIYRVDALQPGKYVVRAFPQDNSRYVSGELAKVFAPNAVTADPEREIPYDVTLAPGEKRTLDLTLDLPPSGKVSGTVAINSRRIRRALAVLRPESGGLSLYSRTDETGTFTIQDVPAGKYTLRLYSPSPRQELHSRQITVTIDTTATVQVDMVAGGLTGRVLTPDGAAAEQVRGYLMIYPGATEMPDDLYKYRQSHRVHWVRVRNGVFKDESLTPGPALLVVDIRGRRPVTTKTTIPSGTTLQLDLTAGKLD